MISDGLNADSSIIIKRIMAIGAQQMAHPVGESKQECLRVDFDRRLKLEFHGSKVTTDAGLFAYRELDASVELTEMAGDGAMPEFG